MIISFSVLLRMRYFSVTSCREDQITHYGKKYFQKSCRLWDSDEKYGMDWDRAHGNIIRLMRFAFWIIRASHTFRICVTYCFATATMGMDWDRAHGNIIRLMRFAFWIIRATVTHSGYVLLIALPRRQWVWTETGHMEILYYSCALHSG